MLDGVIVGNGPVNRIDPLGLFDVFGYVDGDLVGIVGPEGGFGIVVDFDNLGEAGVFGSAEPSGGANVGIGAGVGFALRDIEGWSYNIDVNAGAVSLSINFYDQGLNGIGLAFDPGT